MRNTSPSFPDVTPFARLVNEQNERNGEMYRDIVERASAEQVLKRIHDHAVHAAAHLAVMRRMRATTGGSETPLADYLALAEELVRLTGLAIEPPRSGPPDAEEVVNVAASCATGDGVRDAREELARVALLAWQELQRTEVGSRPTVMAVYVFAHVLGEGLELV